MNVARLVVLAILAAATGARADELDPVVPTEIKAPFALFVNQVAKGDIIVLLREGDVLVERQDLLRAGIAPLGGRDVEVAGQRLLSLRSVSPPLVYELDEEQVALRVTAPPELLPFELFDLKGRPPELVYTRDVSAFLNYAPRVTDRGRIELYEEVGVSADGNLLFSSAYLSSERDPVRGLTNFNLDEPRAARRIVLGDALIESTALSSGPFVGGVTIERSYDIDPYAIKSPGLGFRGSTLTPATLDVYVNGARVHSEELKPGTFELSNLHAASGSGVATYVLRDAFGRETEIATPYYMTSSVLAAGYEEFTYSAGVVRSRVGTESWDYGPQAILGRHRLGLSDELTIGGRAEASAERVSAGPSLTVLTPIGQWDLELAASRDNAGDLGAAGSLGYTYLSRSFGGGFFTRLFSDHYATLDLAPEQDRATVDVGGSISVPVGRNVSFSYQSMLAAYRDRGLLVGTGLQAQGRITNQLVLVLAGRRSLSSYAPESWEVTLTLHATLSSGHSASITPAIRDGKPALGLDANRSLPSTQGYGYRASASLAETSSATGTVQYQSLVGRYTAGYSVFGSEHSASASAAGALVVVPGVGVLPTLPVQQAFGIVRVRGVENVRGQGNNQQAGVTNADGNLVVPNLMPYYGNRLSITPEDVPLQYRLEHTEMVLAPPMRGVAIADFGVSMARYYRGRLVIVDGGNEVIPKFGQVRILLAEGELVSPLGELGEFELDGLAGGRYTAVIEHTDGTCELALSIPESEEPVVDLGELTCHVRSN